MKYDPALHHRRSVRLDGYDYAQTGAYFVTLVAHGRACLFGEVVGEEMRLNAVGKVVKSELQLLASRFRNVKIPVYVVMPNHVHAILIISELVGATHPNRIEPVQSNDGLPLRRPSGPAPGSLGALIGQFKSRVTRRLGKTGKVWQRNYYEHIIRNQAEMEKSPRISRPTHPIGWRMRNGTRRRRSIGDSTSAESSLKNLCKSV